MPSIAAIKTKALSREREASLGAGWREREEIRKAANNIGGQRGDRGGRVCLWKRTQGRFRAKTCRMRKSEPCRVLQEKRPD